MLYLISSPTRVGGHYLLEIIFSTGSKVEKTHIPTLDVDYENTCLIILNRRNRFNAVMSALITYRTKQFKNYTPIDIEPFKVNQVEFFQEYTFNKTYVQLHDFKKSWKKIEYLYFEDFLNFPYHVFEKLDLVQIKKINWSQKSIFRYQDLIINVDECKQWYRQLEDYLHPDATAT